MPGGVASSERASWPATERNTAPRSAPLGRLFLSVAVQVGLRDGPSLFFEVINREPFLEMFDRG